MLSLGYSMDANSAALEPRDADRMSWDRFDIDYFWQDSFDAQIKGPKNVFPGAAFLSPDPNYLELTDSPLYAGVAPILDGRPILPSPIGGGRASEAESVQRVESVTGNVPSAGPDPYELGVRIVLPDTPGFDPSVTLAAPVNDPIPRHRAANQSRSRKRAHSDSPKAVYVGRCRRSAPGKRRRASHDAPASAFSPGTDHAAKTKTATAKEDGIQWHCPVQRSNPVTGEREACETVCQRKDSMERHVRDRHAPLELEGSPGWLSQRVGAGLFLLGRAVCNVCRLSFTRYDSSLVHVCAKLDTPPNEVTDAGKSRKELKWRPLPDGLQPPMLTSVSANRDPDNPLTRWPDNLTVKVVPTRQKRDRDTITGYKVSLKC